jgi:hypothetical protein
MKLSTIVAGSAASVLLLSGLAFAQQQQFQQGQGQPITSREVRQFVSGIERDVNQMVQSRDLSRLRQWTQSHVADHAVLSRTNTIETEGHSRVMSSVTITKPDLMRLESLVISGMSEKLNSLQDYRLNIQVQHVEPVGDSAAIVKSHIRETATITPHQGEGGRTGQREHDMTTGQAPQSETGEEYEEGQRQHSRQGFHGQQGSVQIELNATCTHMVERNRDSGRLQFGMAICDATTEAQM